MFLTYDITRDETFANLSDWLKEIQQHAAEDVKIYLIGNKAELDEQREVKFERAIEFAKQHGIHKCFETSAKSGQNVEEVFSCAGKELFEQTEKESQKDKEEKQEEEDPVNVKDKNQKLSGGKKKKAKKGGCC